MTISALTTIRAMTFVDVPPPQPSLVNTVAVAIVTKAASTVSQPTVRIQETSAGTRLPYTP